MNAITLISLFERDLNKLITEVELYKNEENLWIVENNITNSAGNLTLHLIGNLNTFIGKEIEKTAYIRDRDLEFSQKNVPRIELIQKINETKIMIKNALNHLTNEDLLEDYPVLKFDETTTIEYLLVHLTLHLNYHLGQINYHRRLLDN
ncbi:Protein of unknown function [Algoriella xinjiangensis]|uniref:DinB superfamily protein n=1 Tax=Algoriella xinjiangensis TaxID=684065 RepID=A0A1I5AL27_9FLAO|nr:DUF1572 family protein [Algoriella xinjiangensis]SFN63137.1 Protein of unknown function [Algoriella xinjiangensis]VDH16284.1 Protein of uncharacterised function (DUF1572) [Algoriella xinjiangensis]